VIIEYVMTRNEQVSEPTRANPSDAGLDVYANFDDPSSHVRLPPSQSVIVPTGLKFGVPHGYMLQVMNRSSVAAKRSLIVGAHVIDSGYDGEVFINLHNVGIESQDIYHGDKIAQIVMVPVVSFRARKADDPELYKDGITISERGDGALGSTNG